MLFKPPASALILLNCQAHSCFAGMSVTAWGKDKPLLTNISVIRDEWDSTENQDLLCSLKLEKTEPVGQRGGAVEEERQCDEKLTLQSCTFWVLSK